MIFPFRSNCRSVSKEFITIHIGNMIESLTFLFFDNKMSRTGIQFPYFRDQWQRSTLTPIQAKCNLLQAKQLNKEHASFKNPFNFWSKFSNYILIHLKKRFSHSANIINFMAFSLRYFCYQEYCFFWQKL